MMAVPAVLHASCVAIDGRGVLIFGDPGAGKSDLALRLIDRGAILVSDDGVAVQAEDGKAIARAPATIAGRMEVRGLGIVETPALPAARIALCVAAGAAERMPPEPLPVRDIAGVAIPALTLDLLEGSAAIKVERALALYGLTA